MKLLSLCLRILAFFMRLAPRKPIVALMSRQSSKPSLDFTMIHDQLVEDLGEGAVRTCFIEPESKGKVAFALGTFKQLSLASRAKVIMVDDYVPAVSIPKKDPAVTVIQIWHSLGAIKKFGYQTIDTPAGHSMATAKAGCMHEKYDIILSSGPGAIPAYAKAFGYDESVFRATGLPGMDFLLDRSPDSPRMQAAARIVQENPFLTNGNRNVVYAPTLRRGPGYEGWIDVNLRALAEACPTTGVNLIFSGHPLDKEASRGVVDEYEVLHIVENARSIDIFELADCIITDYSAMSLDAGLLGKDTCFYLPDYEMYAASPGMNVDLMDRSIAFASTDAAEIMAQAVAVDPAAQVYFDRWRTFALDYLGHPEPGITQRICRLAESYL